jgi:hypothetical protein
LARQIRTNECGHPELPHRARGMCNNCYVEHRRSYMRDYAENRRTDWTRHEGVVRVGISGWGYLPR